MNIDLPYGAKSIRFSVSEDRVIGVLQNIYPGRKSVKKLIIKSLRQKNIHFRKKKVLIVVPDSTRSAHLKDILPVLIQSIKTPSHTIDIIIATGIHKKHTPEQVAKLLGPSVSRRYKILHHDPSGAGITSFGNTKYGVPATLDKAVLKYDFIISVGVVEPHLYAGYSGGAKTVAIGLAGEETINATHIIKFLDDPGTNIGSVTGNKFQETLWHIIGNIPPVFSVNTVNDQDGKALKVFCGDVKDVFEKSVDFARKVFGVDVKQQCDIAICGIGYPKDINLYQASRAMNYVLNVDRPVLRKGGVLIIAAELKDGLGDSAAERRFYDELKKMKSAQDFISRIRNEGCIAGEHRAYMVAKALAEYNVIFVTIVKKSFMDGLPFKFYTNIEAALAEAEGIVGKNSKIYVIPRSLATIPRQS